MPSATSLPVRIYLDHNATSPLRDEVVETMTRVMRDHHGNPSSVHEEGRAARAEMDRARERVAALLGTAPEDVMFTGGATEANNTVLLGMMRARSDGRRHLVTTSVEHPSIEEPVEILEREGWRVTRVGVDHDGILDENEVAEAIGDDTALVSIIWANNETGVLQPMDRRIDAPDGFSVRLTCFERVQRRRGGETDSFEHVRWQDERRVDRAGLGPGGSTIRGRLVPRHMRRAIDPVQPYG